MSRKETSSRCVDRRSVLRSIGAASSLTMFGISSAAAQNDKGKKKENENGEKVLNKIELDTSDKDNLEQASVVFVQAGDVVKSRAHIDLAYDVPEPDSDSSDNSAGVRYSLSLDPDAAEKAVSASDISEGVDTLDKDNFSIEEKSVADVQIGGEGINTQGLSDPDYGDNWDGGAWVETNSSECGTLVRSTSVWNNDWNSDHYEFGDHSLVTNTVDGAACDGESFGDRFPCPDEVIDCSVPDSFNTTWHTEDYDYSKSGGELHQTASFWNKDFPVIPKTNADHEADVFWKDDTTVKISGSVDHYGTFNEAIRYLLKWDVGTKFW
ncbi:amidase [Halogeometricum borinquense]|nr:amidase [Halogeometricum borinquense]